jgi:hypothetical protein
MVILPSTLDFSVSYRYKSTVEGIEVPVIIRVGGYSVEAFPKLDTGAASCVFERRHAPDTPSGRRSWPVSAFPDSRWELYRIRT